MKRFVVAADHLSDAQERQFLRFLTDHHASWWHWVENVWLVVDREGDFQPSTLRDALTSISEGGRFLIMEIQGSVGWAGFGPGGDEKNMFDWLKTVWKDAQAVSA